MPILDRSEGLGLDVDLDLDLDLDADPDGAGAGTPCAVGTPCAPADLVPDHRAGQAPVQLPESSPKAHTPAPDAGAGLESVATGGPRACHARPWGATTRKAAGGCDGQEDHLHLHRLELELELESEGVEDGDVPWSVGGIGSGAAPPLPCATGRAGAVGAPWAHATTMQRDGCRPGREAADCNPAGVPLSQPAVAAAAATDDMVGDATAAAGDAAGAGGALAAPSPPRESPGFYIGCDVPLEVSPDQHHHHRSQQQQLQPQVRDDGVEVEVGRVPAVRAEEGVGHLFRGLTLVVAMSDSMLPLATGIVRAAGAVVLDAVTAASTLAGTSDGGTMQGGGTTGVPAHRSRSGSGVGEGFQLRPRWVHCLLAVVRW